MTLCLVGSAWAQESEPDSANVEDESPAQPEVSEPAAEPESSQSLAATAGLDLYGITESDVPAGGRMDWAARREIRVIQKRAMLKEARHAFTVMGGVVPNDDFFTYLAGGLGYQYYFSEDFALNVLAAYTHDSETGLREELNRNYPEGPNLIVRLPEVLRGYSTVGVDWNLVHGKLGFFSTELAEFDLAIGFGVGGVFTRTTDQGKNPEDGKFVPAGNIGAGLQFYLGERIALGLNFRQFFYAAYDGKNDDGSDRRKGVSYPISTTLGLTWFSAAPN